MGWIDACYDERERKALSYTKVGMSPVVIIIVGNTLTQHAV